MTAAGLVVVSDLIHRAVYALQYTSQEPQGTFLFPQGWLWMLLATSW